MTLKDRLMDDLRQAMRAQDTLRRDLIRFTRAAIQNAEIEWQHEASDAEVLQVLAREVKRRQESIALFRQGRRQDLVDREESELAVLQTYLPEQMSEGQVRQTVQQVIAELGAHGQAQLGAVMKLAMARIKGEADGRAVNQIARELLSS